jgi:enoyl-CoA hydratase
MISAIAARLAQWAADAEITAVAIRGAGDRAFCAGGDIRAVRQSAQAGTAEGAELLRAEYRMNALIGSYPKPYVALLHGICMGGGAGVSVHGKFRLADASLSFAMPETGIGFIPDVGGSYFLSRAPGEMGMYLGLTASSIGLADALEAGLMTHAVERKDFDAVIEAMTRGEDVTRFAVRPKPGPLHEHRRRIETIFAGASVEAILERLERDGSEFAQATSQAIRSRSPTSLKLVFRQLRTGSKLDLKQCLAMEFRLALRLLKTPDFREGIRAALVDKDRNPKWQPSSLAGVGDLDPFFASLGADELFGENSDPRSPRAR